MKQLQQMIEAAQRSRLWGQIQLDFQNGALVLIRRTETFKLEENNQSYGNSSRSQS
jgi:hypothetical protein